MDGRTSTWTGVASGADYEWNRPAIELPTASSYREFRPGPDVYLTAKLWLHNARPNDGATNEPA